MKTIKNTTDKIILGKGAEYSSDCYETQLNNNIIVCGSSGCGKTRSISEVRLLETRNSSIVTTMSKKRLADEYIPLFRERGYKVMAIDFASPEKSLFSFDPLKFIHNAGDVSMTAEAIVKAGKSPNQNMDEYWDQTAESLLSAEIMYVMMTNNKATFADVLDFHANLTLDTKGDGFSSNYDKLFAELEKAKPGCQALRYWKSFSSTSSRTAGTIYSTLNTTIDKVFTGEIRNLIASKPCVDLRSIADERTALFMITSPVNPSLNTFVNMFYSRLFKELFEYAETKEGGVLPIPVHVLCDDFACGAAIQNFPEYISIFREKGISVTMLLQSESQLEAMYGCDNAKTIINNSDTYIYMGGSDLTTARNISYRLNVPLDEVLYMPIGKEVVFRRGSRPFTTERYDIRENEHYISLERCRFVEKV